MKNNIVIAVCGKGGVGKTVFSSCLVRTLSEMGKKVLAVDADPAGGLSYMLGLPSDIKTLGEAKNDLIARARANRNADEIIETLNYLLLNSLYEMDKFDFLGMGKSQQRGCFCSVNSLLKDAIQKIGDNYDAVVIDAEAGLEQINREVMSSVNRIAILVDGSRRSVNSMENIIKLTEYLGINASIGIVWNRQMDFDLAKNKILFEINIPILGVGVMPEDDLLRHNDAIGKTIFELPNDSPLLESVKDTLKFLI